MYGVTAIPALNDELTKIDAKLAAAYTDALGDLQQLLAMETEETEVLHRYAKELHQRLERITENRHERGSDFHFGLAQQRREDAGRSPSS